MPTNGQYNVPSAEELLVQEFREHICSIVAFPLQLSRTVHELPDAQVRLKPANQWSIAEHIGHLIDIDRLYLQRIELILAQEHQPFALFSIDAIHQQRNYQTRPIAELIAVLTETHSHIVHIIQGLTTVQMMRIGLDSYFRTITLARLIEVLVNHQDEHYHHICKIADYPPQ